MHAICTVHACSSLDHVTRSPSIVADCFAVIHTDCLFIACIARPVPGVDVELKGCVDPVDNRDSNGNPQPFIKTTDSTGLAVFGQAPEVVQYCYGSAHGFCSWTAVKDGVVYESDKDTLMKDGKYVTANDYTGCKCDGTDHCDPTYTYPIIELKPRCCPDTPDTPQCPTTCSFEVVAKGKKHIVSGMCSSNFADTFTSKTTTGGDKPVCPDGYLNTRQPCTAGKDCGVCCVDATKLCYAKTNGKCARQGGQCMCKQTRRGANCNSFNFPDYIKWWDKNKNQKCDAFGNVLSDDTVANLFGKDFDKVGFDLSKSNFGKIDLSRLGFSPASGRHLLTGSYDNNDKNDMNGGGCEDSMCNAVAVKAGFSAACCPFGCD